MIFKRFFFVCLFFYLYSLLLQTNYQVWEAYPQNPRTHCVCPPKGKMESLGLLQAAKVFHKRCEVVTVL